MPLSVRRPGVTALGRRRCFTGPTRSGPCWRAPHVRRRGRAARGRRTYARTRVKIQTWFLNSVLIAESHRTICRRSRLRGSARAVPRRRGAPLPRLPRMPRSVHCVRIGVGVWCSPRQKCDVDEVFPLPPPRFPVEDQSHCVSDVSVPLGECGTRHVARRTPVSRNGQAGPKRAVRAMRERAGEEELSICGIDSSTGVYREVGC